MRGQKRKTPRGKGGPAKSVIGLERYKGLLLAKRQELSVSATEASAPVPAAGGWQGDLIDQANADAEAELQVRLRQTVWTFTPSDRGSLGSDQARHFRCV